MALIALYRAIKEDFKGPESRSGDQAIAALEAMYLNVLNS
jgi:hypothetical protein